MRSAPTVGGRIATEPADHRHGGEITTNTKQISWIATDNIMTIKVNLDFYNKDHKVLLTTTQPYAGAGTAAKVAFYRRDPVIRRADFLSYLLIHRQTLNGYQSYQDLLAKIDTATTWIQDVIVSAGPTIQLAQHGYTDGNLSELIGESVGLSVISRLHGMTDADWTKLDTISGINGLPTFDFQIGSNGARIIQLEAKGSFVGDCTKKPSKVGNHARKIAVKKSELDQQAIYKYPSSIRYGTIAAIDAVHDAQCWLLDPPAQDMQIAPGNLRIAKRLGFAAKSIALVAPTASLPVIIAKRISEIWSGNPDAFDGNVLRTTTGAQFSHQTYVERYLSSNKTYLRDIDVVGKLLPTDRKSPIFIGMKGDLARSAIKQNFDAISKIEYDEPDLGVHEIDSAPPIAGERTNQRKRIPMNLIVSSGGLVFGHAVS